MDFLLEIAELSLPVVIREQKNVDLLRVLVAAELVVANLPPLHSHVEKAEVLEITALGRAYIQHGQHGKSQNLDHPGAGSENCSTTSSKSSLLKEA